MFDTDYWKRRFEESGGYSLREKFSPMDLINARIRYGFDLDDGAFGRVLDTFSILDTEEFFSGIVCPVSAIYDGSWKKYRERGMDFRDSCLIRVLAGDFEAGEDQKRRASSELKKSGYTSRISEEYKPQAKEIPARIEYGRKSITDFDFSSIVEEESF